MSHVGLLDEADNGTGWGGKIESYAFYVWFTHTKHAVSNLAWYWVKALLQAWAAVVFYPKSTKAPEQADLGLQMVVHYWFQIKWQKI